MIVGTSRPRRHALSGVVRFRGRRKGFRAASDRSDLVAADRTALNTVWTAYQSRAGTVFLDVAGSSAELDALLEAFGFKCAAVHPLARADCKRPLATGEASSLQG